jgi:hypothetical protein
VKTLIAVEMSGSCLQNTANMNVWVSQAILTDYLGPLEAKMNSENSKILLSWISLPLIPMKQVI